ncbi:hypothetical protein QQ045_010674 [Rhodiola kirilowii]
MKQERWEEEVEAIADKMDGKLVVSFEDEDWKRMEDEGRWATVVKLANGMPFNIKGLANVLTKIWNMENRVNFAELANNMALARFKTEGDLKKIRDGGPWLCMDSFIIMHDWCPDLAPDEFKMDRLGVWAQMHNLPVGAALKDKEYGEKLAGYIGKFIRVSQSESEGARKRFIRMRVEIEIDKPLISGFFLRRLNKDPLWVSVKYERLPECCGTCRRLTHATGECKYAGEPELARSQRGVLSENGRGRLAHGGRTGEEEHAHQDCRTEQGKITTTEKVYKKLAEKGKGKDVQDKSAGKQKSSVLGGTGKAGAGSEEDRGDRTDKEMPDGHTMEVEGIGTQTSKATNDSSLVSMPSAPRGNRSEEVVRNISRGEESWHDVDVLWEGAKESTYGEGKGNGGRELYPIQR